MAVGQTAYMLANKVLFLLREETYNQDPALAPNIPTPADFPYAWLLSDLNVAQQVFMGDTGFAPRLTEKRVSLPMVAGLDYVLPADLVSLTRIEYQSPAIATNPYKLIERNFDYFDMITNGGLNIGDVGAPTDYRSPFGSGSNVAVRLWPQPSFGNAGQASSGLTISGLPAAGNTLFATLSNGIANTVVGPYTLSATDTIYSAALGLAALINASGVVTGGGAYLQSAFTNGSATILLAAIASGVGGNAYAVSGAAVGTIKISPTVATKFTGGGTPDNIILYYTSYGNLMVAGSDQPGIPPAYHNALAYYVLKDYWRRKEDPDRQADRYQRDYAALVKDAKAYIDNTDSASTPAFIDEEQVDGGQFVWGIPG